MKKLIAVLIASATLSGCVNLSAVRETEENLAQCVQAYVQLGQTTMILKSMLESAQEPQACKGA